MKDRALAHARARVAFPDAGPSPVPSPPERAVIVLSGPWLWQKGGSWRCRAGLPDQIRRGEGLRLAPREPQNPPRAKKSAAPGTVENGLSNRENTRSINGLRAYTVHLFHSRRRAFVVGMSFFLNSVLTVRKGLAYNPPIDAAPRFTGPARRHLKLLSHLLVHDASDPGQKAEFQSPFAKGGSLTVPVL